MRSLILALVLTLPVPALAQNVTPAPTVAAASLDPALPVTAADIADRKYVVLGPIHTNVRKATVFSKAASETKVFKELWERARKMGADAVILASYGKSHVTMTSWGSKAATGTAIKWVDGGNGD